MQMMDHPNIVRLFETFEDRRKFYLVMELCAGGELFDRILEARRFTEREAAVVMQQVLRAVRYMHRLDIAHRDLKPENFVFLTAEPIESNVLKVIDFGLACKFEEGQVLTTKAGTPYYVAPQVLAGKYDQSSDLWSLGVIMYVLLCGYPPFLGRTEAEILQRVSGGRYAFPEKEWKAVTPDAKRLIDRMLAYEARHRCSAEAALLDPWLLETSGRAPDTPLQSSHLDGLRSFSSSNRLKRAALHCIARRMSEQDIQQLKGVFLSMDKNKDGVVTLQELQDGLDRLGSKELFDDIKDLMNEADMNQNQVLDYTEFIAATLNSRAFQEERAMWAAFCVFDADGDGAITRQELESALQDEELQEVMGSKSVQLAMQECDADTDDRIDFQEFRAMLQKAAA
mmetsp:Transcript_37112/g.114344  ORF Transcript_37112/g.114344 Transcript_37112/m.114344 type:complete len:397 (+) Transcript_37112:397-1587(+)